MSFRYNAIKRRNCDVGTPLEQLYRFQRFCRRHTIFSNTNPYACCSKGCPLIKRDKRETVKLCEFLWLQRPYRSDKHDREKIESKIKVIQA